MSAGGLELYAACPTRWMVERFLRPRSPEPNSEPLARGALAHRALAGAFERLRAARGSARLEPAALPEAYAALDEALAEHAAETRLSPDPAVHAVLLRRIEADLRRLLEHEAGCGSQLEPEHFELRFGLDRDGLPPLELDGGRVILRGQIDRVDVDRERGEAVVRDYKASACHPAATWERDDRLQVALYMLAVERLLGLRPVGGLYQPLTGADIRARGLVLDDACERVGDGCVRTDVKPADELDAILAAAEQRAVELAERLAAGELAPSPATCSPAGCAYPGVCRGGEG
jgi:ATP-dependent helicase/DNAse subunit B